MATSEKLLTTTIILKDCRCKFQGPQPVITATKNIALIFDDATCRIDHDSKSLATLRWEAVTALKLQNKPFGSASIFLELSKNPMRGGGGLIYLYAEFDNKQAGKLEAVLETAIPKVVRKQDVPDWLYGNWFKSGFPASIYSRQLRLAINFTNITVQSALLAWIIVSFVSHLDTAFTAAEARPVPKAVQWFRTLNDPVEAWLHTKAWPFIRSNALLCVPVLTLGAIAFFPVVIAAVLFLFGWDIIYHATVLLFHLFQFNNLIRQAYSNIWQVISLVKYTIVWAANFRRKKDQKPKTE